MLLIIPMIFNYLNIPLQFPLREPKHKMLIFYPQLQLISLKIMLKIKFF